jgi:hypothetical protein
VQWTTVVIGAGILLSVLRVAYFREGSLLEKIKHQ